MGVSIFFFFFFPITNVFIFQASEWILVMINNKMSSKSHNNSQLFTYMVRLENVIWTTILGDEEEVVDVVASRGRERRREKGGKRR